MKKSKSSLFLMELIIVVLFFALTSAVCLQVFVKAHRIDMDTRNTNHAIIWGDNISEIFYEVHDNQYVISSLIAPEYNLLKDETGSVCVYLNSNYSVTDNIDDAAFKVSFKTYSDASFYYLDYSFLEISKNSIVFKFTYKSNIQEVCE